MMMMLSFQLIWQDDGRRVPVEAIVYQDDYLLLRELAAISNYWKLLFLMSCRPCLTDFEQVRQREYRLSLDCACLLGEPFFAASPQGSTAVGCSSDAADS